MWQEYQPPSNWPPPPPSDKQTETTPEYDLTTSPEKTQSAIYQQALMQANAKIRFYWHLAIYIIVNTGLWIFAVRTLSPSETVFYPMYIILIWGWVLFWHWCHAFNQKGLTKFELGKKYRQRMVEAELRRMSKNNR